MTRFGPNPAGSTYFGPQDATAGLMLQAQDLAHAQTIETPVILIVAVVVSVNPPTPREGQAGVVLTMINAGAAQGSVTFDGLACTVTAWADNEITVTMPIVSNPGSTTPLNAFRDLIVIRADAQTSPPFSLQLTTQAAKTYVASVPNDTGLQSVVDSDPVVLGSDFLHFEVAAGTITDLSQMPKAVPAGMSNGAELLLNVWDGAAWGAYGTKTFQLSNITGDPADLAHAHTLGTVPVTAGRNLAPANLAHIQGIGTPTIGLPTEDLAHAQALTAPTLARTAPLVPVDMTHAQNLTAPLMVNTSQAQPLPLEHAHTIETVSISVSTTIAPQDLTHAQTIETPAATVNRQVAVADLTHSQFLGRPSLGRIVLSPVGLTHTQAVATARLTPTKEALEFRDLAQTMQAKVMFHLGEDTIIDPDGNPKVVNGVWDFDDYTASGGLGFEGNQITLDLYNIDAKLLRGDEVVRQADGKRYRAKEIKDSDFNYTNYVMELVG